MNVHSDVHEKDMTGWFPKNVEPVRVGCYRTSAKYLFNRAEPTFPPMGWAYSWWNGYSWENFGVWGVYHNHIDFVWRGLIRNMQLPQTTL